MNIGYFDDYEEIELDFKNRGIGVKYLDNCFYYDAEDMEEEIDLYQTFKKYEVIIDVLEKFWIHSNQATIVNLDLLKQSKKIKEVSISNCSIDNIEWISPLLSLNYLHLSNIWTTLDDIAKGSFYHPIKSLVNLEKLNLSFTGFDDQSVFLSEDTTIFDQLLNLNYLSLRETHIENVDFLSYIKSNDILLNYSDNSSKLDFNKYGNIKLVTKTKLINGTIMDILHLIGKY